MKKSDKNTIAQSTPDATPNQAKPNQPQRGPMKSGPAKSGPVKSGPVKSAQAGSGSAKSGSAKSGPAKTSAAMSGKAKPGVAKAGSARPDPARSGNANPGAARAGNAKRKPITRKPGGLDAAAQVLDKSKTPMSCGELTTRILDLGLWESDGKTPAATIHSAIVREIKAKGASARFRKVGRGLFAAAKPVR